MSNLRGALINSVAIIPWRRDIRVFCEHPVDMRRVSRSAALHLSRCNRPPVVDREAAHEDALIIRGVKPRITGELPPSPSPSPSFTRESRAPERVFVLRLLAWGPFCFSPLEHAGTSSRPRPFDHALSLSLFLPRTASVSGIPPAPLTRVSVFAQHIIYRPQLVMRQKTCWFPLPHRPALRRAATIRGDLLRRAPTMGLPRPREVPLCSVAGAARSYRDSDRWISSIICGGSIAWPSSRVKVVNCIQEARVLNRSRVPPYGYAIYYRADRDLYSTMRYSVVETFFTQLWMPRIQGGLVRKSPIIKHSEID